MKFYELYHPEYPEILVKSIAQRIDGIVQKTRTGEKLTEEEKQLEQNLIEIEEKLKQEKRRKIMNLPMITHLSIQMIVKMIKWTFMNIAKFLKKERKIIQVALVIRV